MSDDKNSAGSTTPPVHYAYAEYKETDQQLESASDNKVLTRPARVFTPEEEKKLYRKVCPLDPAYWSSTVAYSHELDRLICVSCPSWLSFTF